MHVSALLTWFARGKSNFTWGCAPNFTDLPKAMSSSLGESQTSPNNPSATFGASPLFTQGAFFYASTRLSSRAKEIEYEEKNSKRGISYLEPFAS